MATRLSRIRHISLILIAFLIGLNLYAFVLFRNNANLATGGAFTNDISIAEEKKQLLVASSSCPPQVIPCRFEGHCPVGTTCVMKPECKRVSPGICEPFYSPNLDTSSHDDSCIQQCLDELTWDERMHHGATIDIVSTTKTSPSQSRPNGCTIRYRRNYNAQHHESDKAIRDDWLNATQHKHVVRVDPLANSSSTTTTIWQALCYEPCNSHHDCAPPAQVAVTNTAFVCISGSCRRNRFTYSYWSNNKNNNNNEQGELVIVTGANEGYFSGLSNLAASARYWAPKNRLVVYNLGLTREQLYQVESWPNVVNVKWKNGIPTLFPPHVRELKQYAWKPLAIQEALREYGMILWIDAGSSLVGPIDAAQSILEQDGILLVKGQDPDLKTKSASDTFEWFGLDKETFLGGASFSGNFQGYVSPSRFVAAIVDANAECALHQECISPIGSNLTTHRYDQTSLSILAYKMQLPHHTELVAGGRKQLNSNLDLPSSRFVVWTARQACRHYVDKGY